MPRNMCSDPYERDKGMKDKALVPLSPSGRLIRNTLVALDLDFRPNEELKRFMFVSPRDWLRAVSEFARVAKQHMVEVDLVDDSFQRQRQQMLRCPVGTKTERYFLTLTGDSVTALLRQPSVKRNGDRIYVDFANINLQSVLRSLPVELM